MRLPIGSLFRPRGMVVTATLVVAALLLWRGESARRAAEVGQVANWVREAARQARAAADGPIHLGDSEPVVASSFGAWVRSASPAGTVGDAGVQAEALGSRSGTGPGTHRVEVTLGGRRAELRVEWSDADAPPRVVAFREVE
jgi:hypothetical protein